MTTNRLRKFLRKFPLAVCLLFGFLAPTQAVAQQGLFNFNYNGPDSVEVGPNCNAALQGNIPNPVVTSNDGGMITVSMFDATSSGFPYNQTFTEGETAHVYWYVEDNHGHNATFEFFIHFVDHTPPTFDLTGIGDTLYLPSVVQVPAVPMIPISDNCVLDTVIFSETTRPDTCLAGSFTRTWTAKDEAGNYSTFTQTIIIAADVAPPTITFPPQNGSSPCTQLSTSYPNWLAAQMAAFTVQDPSGIKSKTNNGPASYPPGCKMPLTVVFKATDNCNLMMSTTAVFTTSDNQAPVVISEPKDTIAYCSPGGNQLTKLNQWISTHAYMQVVDSCSDPLTYTTQVNGNNADSSAIVSAFNASFSDACGTRLVGSQNVNKVSALVRVDFFVTDACGNQTFAGQATFAAVDTLPPVITGANTTEQCGGGNDQTVLEAWINAKGNAALADDCSSAMWDNFNFTTSDGQSGAGSFNSGPYPQVQAHNCIWFADVTFFASDECGNSSSKKLRFQIIDTQPPVITGLAPNITVHCPDPLPVTPAATITDNCDTAPTITFSRVYQDSLCDGSYTVVTTWKATDACNNSATAVQNIFVRDTTRPVFTLVPANFTARCDTFALPPVPVFGMNINATDICSPVVTISTAINSAQNPDPALCSHYTYDITRIFTATDECGNTRTATQVISVIDNQPPVPGGILDTTALCSALSPFPAPTPIATDPCSGLTAPPQYLDVDSIPNGCVGKYTLQLHWVASDVCGNQINFDQLVHVIDTVPPQLSNIPPDITVECNNIPTAPNTATFNGVDDCGSGVTVSLAETELRDPDPMHCEHWTNWTLRREWTASDDCGNTRSYTQNIHIQDTTPPVVTPQSNITLANDPGDCGATIVIPAPLSVYDNCTSLPNSVLLKDTLPILPLPSPVNGSQPVDTLFFHFNLPNTPPGQPATTNVNLTVFIEKADAESATEFFKIYGEQGVFIGNTTPTPGQCSNTPGATIISITQAQFNLWAQDGALDLILAPNVAANTINPTCGNARVRANLAYSWASPQVPAALNYSLDGAPMTPFPPADSTYLPTGTHTVVYQAIDCAGNSSTASVQITVNDTEPPTITPPATLIAYVNPDSCLGKITLPFPVISENCTMSGHLLKTTPFIPLTFYNDPDAPEPIPNDVLMSLSGLIPNAVGLGTLKFRFKGDNAQPREFFELYQGPGLILNSNLGTVAGQCHDTVETVQPINAALLNAWAASGTATFTAKANKYSGPLFDFDFINPCSDLLADQTDGISEVQLSLEYNYALLTYTVTNNATGSVVATGMLTGSQTMLNLPPGGYTVQYQTVDDAGLSGMTTFQAIVRDTIKPNAICKPSVIIKVNPSGVDNYILTPAQVNNFSSDNCTGTNLVYSLSQTTFNCSQAGNNYIVTLTVTDTSGNSSTCTTVVGVQNDPPVPTYDPVCEGDTLFLYAHPPTPGVFSYSWSGPSFSSTLQNPIILNTPPGAQGLYTVTVTGATGCTASGAVSVTFASLTVPGISTSGGSTSFCSGQNIVLSTPTYSGNSISYLWYENTSPSPTLLASTTLPTYTISQPSVGQHQYFVKVKIGDCLTPNSLVLTTTVYQRPTACVLDNNIFVCEGEPLTVCSCNNGPGVVFNWSGPNGFVSGAPCPLVTSTTTQAAAGVYTLCTYQNGCISIPCAYDTVHVNHTPPKPQIMGDSAVCIGQNVTLTANVSGVVSSYQWQRPDGSTFDTLASVITIPNVQLPCGTWRVRARDQSCFSPWSDVFNICPTPYPDVTATSNSPICKDSLLNLTATASIGGLSWCWTLPGGTQVYQQNLSLMPGLPGVYQVIGKNGAAACADTALVTVVTSVPPVIDVIQNNSPVCDDGVTPACLLPNISGGTPPLTYSWTRSGSQVSTSLTLCLTHFPMDNGAYTLVVKDSLGCPSSSGTVNVNVQPKVATPQLQISPNPVCEGQDVTLSLVNSGNYGAVAQFFWVTPAGDTIQTDDPQLVLPSVQLNQTGDYYVLVGETVCRSDNSNTIKLTVNAIPPAPILTSNQPTCIGTVLQLDANDIPGASYMWTGPGGFSSILQNPSISNVTTTYQGVYTAKVTINGCTSPASTINVDIMEPPKTPVINPPNPLDPNAPEPVCLEQTISKFLSISQSTQTFGAIYTWLDGATHDTIGTPSTSPSLSLATLPAQYLTPGIHTFQVVAWKQDNPNGQGCNTPLSNTVSIRFDTIPDNMAQTDPDHPACSSSIVVLNAVHPSGNITGQWAQIGGPAAVIFNRDSSMARFNGVAVNTYAFTWTLSSGGCKNFSTDTILITVVPPQIPYAGVDTFICDGSSFSLNATQGQYSSGMWSQMGQNVTIADPSEPQSPVSNMYPGNRYFFVWTLANIGCGAKSDTMSVSYYSTNPTIEGLQSICSGENTVHLKASGIQNWETGVWTGGSSNLQFTPNNAVETNMTGLQTGPNVAIWTINGGVCGPLSQVTHTVNYEIFPQANNDIIDVNFGEQKEFNVLGNDILPLTPPSDSVIIKPLHGQIIGHPAIGTFIYRPNTGFSGEDQLTYRICNSKCQNGCSTAVVTFRVGKPGDCFVPSIITPNNDSYNDVFDLPPPCLVSGEGGPVDAQVTIFNQWGDQVFNKKLSEAKWDGTYNGHDLPAGTYFYVVKLDNEPKARTGFVLLQR